MCHPLFALASGGSDGRIRQLDATQSLNQSLLHKQKDVQAAWVSEYDGVQVNGWPAGPLRLGSEFGQTSADESGVFSLAVHSEGVWCVAGTHDGNVHLSGVRMATGETIHSCKPHKV